MQAICRVVSATDMNKYSWTPPLQDNVEIVLNRLKDAYPWTEVLWKSEWINIKHKLIALIMLAFSVLFDQVTADSWHLHPASCWSAPLFADLLVPYKQFMLQLINAVSQHTMHLLEAAANI